MTGVEERGDLLQEAMEQQRMFQGAPSFLAILRGPDHVFAFANDAYLELIGHTPCLGRRFRDAQPGAAALGFADLLDTVYRTGEPYRARDQRVDYVSGRTGEANSLVLTFQFQPMRDANGLVTGIYVEGMDVTQRAEAEASRERLRLDTESRWEEMETIYQNAPIGLVLLDARDLRYRRMNRTQSEILGLAPEQVLGRTVREISPSVADLMEAHFRELAAGGEIRNLELEGDLPQQPGERRSWLVSYAPMFLPDGTLDAVICTGLETTEMKRAERLARQNEKLAAVGRMAGAIAHEINNPLEAVTNLLFLARYSTTLEDAREYLDTADLELRRVSAITSQTLRFHRQATEPRCVACDDLLGSALSIYQGRLVGLGVSVEKRKRAHRPVLCFDGEIRQVLNNFVGNAIDAMGVEGGTLRLRSREGTDWRTGREGLWLTVADSGAGMSPEARRRAFEPFFTTKGISGTGLGLWISGEIVKRHGGLILIRSSQRPGHSGTAMNVFLPYNAVRR